MIDPIFVKTHYDYDSYQDLYELIKLSDFPICDSYKIDWKSRNTYIIPVHNGEFPNPLPRRKCKVIWLNIERPGGYDIDLWKQFDDIWLCDQAWANETGAKFFLMGSDERLGHTGSHDGSVIALAYANGRRGPLFAALNIDNTQAFGEAKKNLLAQARAMVVFHQDVAVISPQRFAYCAAAHLPLLYEAVPDFSPFILGEHFMAISDNVEFIRGLLTQDLQFLGENLYHKLCVQTNFRLEVERMFS